MYACRLVWVRGSDKRARVRMASWPFRGRSRHRTGLSFSRPGSGGGGWEDEPSVHSLVFSGEVSCTLETLDSTVGCCRISFAVVCVAIEADFPWLSFWKTNSPADEARVFWPKDELEGLRGWSRASTWLEAPPPEYWPIEFDVATATASFLLKEAAAVGIDNFLTRKPMPIDI